MTTAVSEENGGVACHGGDRGLPAAVVAMPDVDGFAALYAAAATGVIVEAMNVGVTAAESPREVIDAADVLINGPSQLAEALRLFADLVTRTPDV